MFKRKGKAPPPKALPHAFDVAVDLWREADHEVTDALARFRTAANPVNRLAVIMAWAVLKVRLEALSSWAIEHQQATDASAWAYARSEALQKEIQQASAVEGRPIVLD
jgi:hypothetical protein